MVELSNEEFLKRLPEAAHLACIICYFKETPIKHSLSDMGVVHELIHLMHIPDETLGDIDRIRLVFKEVLELC